MNLRQIIREEILNVISEIGEGTGKVLPWDIVEIHDIPNKFEIIEYKFKTEKSTYNVYITLNKNADLIGVSFDINSPKVEFSDITNFNEIPDIMATIMDIVIDYVNIREDEIDIIKLMPSKSYTSDSRRFKLYMAYINKNISKLPGSWKVSVEGTDTIFIKKQ